MSKIHLVSHVVFVNEAGELEQQECVIYGVSIYSDDMYLEVMRYVFVQ